MASLALQNAKSRVMIIDDHTLVRIGLTELINQNIRFDVVGVASSCATGIKLAYELLPDIIILDTELADTSGCSSLYKLQSLSPDVSVVIYCSNQDHKFIDEAFKHKISAYVLKCSPLDTMLHAIETVNDGMQFIDPRLSSYRPSSTDKNTSSKNSKLQLTDREETILNMLAMGKANKEIANELYITERTVKFHVSAILKRLNVKNRTQAVRVAIEVGLLTGPDSSQAILSNTASINQTRQVVDRRKESHIHPQFERRSGRDRRRVDRAPAIAFSS